MENDAKAMASITQDSTLYIRVGGTISLESSKSIVQLKLTVVCLFVQNGIGRYDAALAA